MVVSTSHRSCVPSIYFHVQIFSTTFLKDALHFEKPDQNFSNMALAQVHEQNNEYVKGVGGHKMGIMWCKIRKLISHFEKLPKGWVYFTYKQETLRRLDSFKSRFYNCLKQVNARFSSNRFNLPNLVSISNINVTFSAEICQTLISTIFTLLEQPTYSGEDTNRCYY